MAEATALRNNALPYPVYGAPWTVVFPLLDADGDLVTGGGGDTPDSEVSKNGDTFADCSNEMTEIATASGMYYLILTAAEMTADIVTVICKTATAGTKTTPIVLYPRKLVALSSGTSQGGAVGYITLAAATLTINDQFNGCLCVATIDGNVESRVLQVCTSGNQQCTVTPNWNVAPDADDTYIIYLPEGMQISESDITAISGNSTAANNLESACDNYSATRGLTGTALPAVVAGAASGIALKDASNFLDVANMPAVTAGAAGGLFIAGSNAATSITTALTANIIGDITGNLSGTVGSVTTKTGYSLADGSIVAATIANAAIDNATFAADVGSTAYATNIIALAVRKALDEIKLDHLVAVADADDPVNNSIVAKLAATGGDWSTFVSSDDALQSIRDRGDAAWTTGAGGSDRLLMIDTTISGVPASQTEFDLAAGSADDNVYNNCTIIVEDVSTATQKAVGMVINYTGATKTVFLKEALAFTIANTDKVYILAENSLKSTVTNRQLDVTATGAAGIDWGNVENKTSVVDLTQTDIQLCDTTTSVTNQVDASVSAAVAGFFQDCFTVDSGEVSGAEVSGSLILEIVKVAWDRVLTGATHNIATSSGRRLRGIQDFQGYEDGAIWIDTVNGSAGTTDFENGTVENPVNTIADANTLAASLGIARFHINPASSITLAATQTNQVFTGDRWTLSLGGQSVSGSAFFGADVSGVGTGAAEVRFEHCHMGAVTLPPSDMERCILESTFTIGAAGNFFFEDCKSGVAGTSTPVLDFGGALNSSDVNFRAYSGGIEIQNMGAGTGSYNLSLEGDGQLVINANCSATSTVAIRGNFTVTDNASGAVTLSDDARFDVAQINAECDTALTDYDAVVPGDLNLTGSGNIGIDWANVENPSTAVDLSQTDIQLCDTITTYTSNTKQTADHTSALTTIDTEVGQIKTVTDALPDAGALTTIGTDTARLTAARAGALTDWINGGRLDQLLDAVKAVTDALTAASAAKLALSAATIVSGAVEAGTLSTTQMTTDLTEATNDHYNGRIIIWTSGVLQNQATDITDYAGATGLLTYTAVTEAPSAADTFIIV